MAEPFIPLTNEQIEYIKSSFREGKVFSNETIITYLIDNYIILRAEYINLQTRGK